MLAEFAFTPSIFDESVQVDRELWRDQLRELGANMFPRTAAWPVMVSNLYESSWHNIVLDIVKGIKDHKAKLLCEDLLQNVTKTLVHRPAHSDWPGDDAVMWGREAIGSHGGEPIERILACKAAHDILASECKIIRCLDEVQGGGFWKDISSTWSQPMTITEQIQTLRKLCVHSGFLCLVTPHIGGGGGDETEFAIDLIRSTLSRPAGYPPGEVEIHTEAPDKPHSSDYPTRLANLTYNITIGLRAALSPGQKLRLVMWPKLLDRYAIAGVYTELSAGTRTRSPRWGISMQHIAREADEINPKPPTPWSLLTRGQLFDEFDRYCKAGVSGFVSSQDIVRYPL